MISIAICDDNEITTQEIAKKVEQCCPVETEFSIFHHPKDLLDSMHGKEKAYDIILMDIEFESGFPNYIYYESCYLFFFCL